MNNDTKSFFLFGLFLQSIVALYFLAEWRMPEQTQHLPSLMLFLLLLGMASICIGMVIHSMETKQNSECVEKKSN